MAETYYSLTELVKLTDNLIAAMPTSYYNGIMAVRNGLASLPAADVVPVVRCRDCVFHEVADYGGGCTKKVCRLLDRQIQDDDFCSYGARMDGDGDV